MSDYDGTTRLEGWRSDKLGKSHVENSQQNTQKLFRIYLGDFDKGTTNK